MSFVLKGLHLWGQSRHNEEEEREGDRKQEDKRRRRGGREEGEELEEGEKKEEQEEKGKEEKVGEERSWEWEVRVLWAGGLKSTGARNPESDRPWCHHRAAHTLSSQFCVLAGLREHPCGQACCVEMAGS